MRTWMGLTLLTVAIGCTKPDVDTGTACVDADLDGTCAEDDCDDADPDAHPGGEERCNGADDDCDGEVDDDATDAATWYADVDRDTHGDPDAALTACEQPDGTVGTALDCDDADATSYPGAAERCDGVPNACGALPAPERDLDGDRRVACTIDTGGWRGDAAITGGGDCDDADATVFPGAPELCDGLVNACGGSLRATETDDDLGGGDGYVECTVDASGWDGAAGVIGGGDCDDTDATVYPTAPELCDGVVNACGTALRDVERDQDPGGGDGFVACAIDAGGWDGPTSVIGGADCDAGDRTVFPGAPELCDGQVNACGGALPAGETDPDGDDYVACALDAGGWDGVAGVVGGGDCAPLSGAISPGATEVFCDGTTQRCGGSDGDVFVGFGGGFTFTDLQAGIDAAAPADVVCVGAGTYYGPVVVQTSGLVIQAMQGPSVTAIQGDTTGRAVHILDAPEVRLAGFRIHGATIPSADGYARNGAGVLVTSSNRVEIAGNVIEDNTAMTMFVAYDQGVGGGVAIDDSSGVRIVGNTVRGNVGGYGGGIGLLETSFDVRIEDNVVDLNTSAGDGGGLGVHDARGTVLRGNTVTDNVAELYGGGLDLWIADGSALVDNTFSGNAASYGGGLSLYANPSLTITDVAVTDNVADIEGGGVFLYESASLVWTGGAIDGNTAPLGGGALLEVLLAQDAVVTFTGATVTENTATDAEGGGMVVYAHPSDGHELELTLADVTFRGNHAGEDGGGLLVEARGGDTMPARVTLASCTFDANTAGDAGGGAVIRHATLAVAVTGGTFVDNVVARVAGGLAVEHMQALTITGTTFEGNVLLATDGDRSTAGGGLSAIDIASFAMTGASFRANEAREPTLDWGYGGGAYLVDLGAATIDGCTFVDNVGDAGGGLLARDLVAPSITGNTFTGNGGGYYGGGLGLLGGTAAIVSDNTFTDNHSAFGGGLAMVDFAQTADFSGNTYAGNAASNRGGGVYLQGVALIPIASSAFSGNSGLGSDLFCSGTGSSSFTADLSTTWTGASTDRRCSGCTSNLPCPTP